MRKGAICTGVDISPVAIRQAHELMSRAKLDAEFVCSDVYGFKPEKPAFFDIVFTSYGSVCWLPDLNRWAEIISSNLALGGTFYIVEFHPIYDLRRGTHISRRLCRIWKRKARIPRMAPVWSQIGHMGTSAISVINALIGAGIQVERVNEFSFSPHNCFEDMVEREPGRFYLSHRGNDVGHRPLNAAVDRSRVECPVPVPETKCPKPER